MWKALKFGIILSIFVFGFILGLFMAPVKYKEPAIPREFPQYLQTLSREGFIVEPKHINEKLWITTETFTYFVITAEQLKVTHIYYALNIYYRYYFWFMYSSDSDVTVRWDIPYTETES